tara:strand:- start:6763 stop:7932 length:1170 start_codon:yes stop_codon:yes gene_type:complete
MKKEYAANFILLIFSTFICFVAGELIIRSIVPKNIWSTVDVSKDFWVLDKKLGWRNKKSLKINFGNTNGEKIVLRTNKDGIYPHTANSYINNSDTKKEIRIALIGDSTMMGRSVDEGKRLADILNIKLNKSPKKQDRRYSVFSYAVEGYNIEQVYASYLYFDEKYKPDIVIYGICHNDWDHIGDEKMEIFAKPRIAINSSGNIQIKEASINEKDLEENNIYYSSNTIKRYINKLALYRISRLYIPKYLQKIGLYSYERGTSYLPIQRVATKESEIIIRKLIEDIFYRMNGNLIVYTFPDVFESEESIIKTYNSGDYDKYQFRSRLEKLLEKSSARESYTEILPMFAKLKGKNITHLLPYDHHLNSLGFEYISEILMLKIQEINFKQSSN